MQRFYSILSQGFKSLASVLVLALFTFAPVYAQSAEGCWVSFYEDTDIPGAYMSVKIDDNGVLSATMTEVLPKPGETEVPTVCTGCPGSFADKPLVGMPILWDLQPDGEAKWDKGQGFSPEQQRTFKADAWLSDDGQVLNVRGKVGLFSKTQQWQRRNPA